jgi:hypothetical protein
MEITKTNTKNSFLQICMGISLVFVSAGFFIHSISTANASPAPMPKDFMTQGAGKTGKYQIVFDTKNTDFYLVNTETGKSLWWNKAKQLWSANCDGAPVGF